MRAGGVQLQCAVSRQRDVLIAPPGCVDLQRVVRADGPRLRTVRHRDRPAHRPRGRRRCGWNRNAASANRRRRAAARRERERTAAEVCGVQHEAVERRRRAGRKLRRRAARRKRRQQVARRHVRRRSALPVVVRGRQVVCARAAPRVDVVGAVDDDDRARAVDPRRPARVVRAVRRVGAARQGVAVQRGRAHHERDARTHLDLRRGIGQHHVIRVEVRTSALLHLERRTGGDGQLGERGERRARHEFHRPLPHDHLAGRGGDGVGTHEHVVRRTGRPVESRIAVELAGEHGGVLLGRARELHLLVLRRREAVRGVVHAVRLVEAGVVQNQIEVVVRIVRAEVDALRFVVSVEREGDATHRLCCRNVDRTLADERERNRVVPRPCLVEADELAGARLDECRDAALARHLSLKRVCRAALVDIDRHLAAAHDS